MMNDATPLQAAPLLGHMAKQLATETARLDARLILGLAMGRDKPVLPHESICLTDTARENLHRLMARRMAGEPVSRLWGRREFYGLDFIITQATLDPRPDSETLVEAALAWLRGRGDSPSILDLGTGSGCLLLSVLYHLPDAKGLGVDKCGDAIAVADNNADALGLSARARFITADWNDGLDESDAAFDCIIANPPYIPSNEIPRLMPPVRDYDPRHALDGGADGLDSMRAIMPRIVSRLAPKSRAFIEIGMGQSEAVQGIAAASGLDCLAVLPDLGGRERCMVFAVTGKDSGA